jgi:hypothetical protein
VSCHLVEAIPGKNGEDLPLDGRAYVLDAKIIRRIASVEDSNPERKTPVIESERRELDSAVLALKVDGRLPLFVPNDGAFLWQWFEIEALLCKCRCREQARGSGRGRDGLSCDHFGKPLSEALIVGSKPGLRQGLSR